MPPSRLPPAADAPDARPWIGPVLARWPDVALDAATFERFVEERGHSLVALSADRIADLWIACACARGDNAAIVAFESAFFGDLRTSLSRLSLDATTFDEARQKLRRELFVAPPDGRPKIAEYAGRGDLRGWLRVTAVRSALKLLRGSKRHAGAGDEHLLERVPVGGDDPDLAYMKELYRPAFKLAFQESLDSLTSREKNLLRQSVLDGLSVDQLAALYGVHRATTARWIVAARETLLTRTRERFMANVRIERAECEEIMRLVQSQLDVTIRRRLAGAVR